jgi:hypothetical protein
MNSKLMNLLMITVFGVFAESTAQMAYAAASVGSCSLLSPAQIQQVTGQPFGDPSLTSAPPAYAGQSAGSNCRYASQNGRHVVVEFIVYIDGSPSEAKQTFDKLAAWFRPKSKPVIGDSAYIDAQGAIHVLKGKVRYYVSIDPGTEKETKELAASIAAGI